MSQNISTCTNPSCDKKKLQRIEGTYALTKVTKGEQEKITFNPASGIPVVCYVCPNCGEVKIYSAKFLNEI